MDKKQSDTHSRVQDRRAEEQQVGGGCQANAEKEARRRLREERDARVEMYQLLSSEFDESEDERGDSKVEMKISLRVNKRLEWAHTFPIQTITQFDIWSFEQFFKKEFDKRGACKGWLVQTIMVVVRSKHTRATQIYQSIDDLSEQWSKAIEVIKTQSAEFYPNLNFRVEIVAIVNKNLINHFV